MRKIILFKVYKGEKKYIGECFEFPIITEGDTIDEVCKNIKEATELFLEEENLEELGISQFPSIIIHIPVEEIYV
ncbi:MAG: type II toxin-antitoxin system HicB family antitoxin [Candidatus Ratteibacteria bacterium]